MTPFQALRSGHLAQAFREYARPPLRDDGVEVQGGLALSRVRIGLRVGGLESFDLRAEHANALV